MHRVPHPPNRGDRIRTFYPMRFLAQRAAVDLAFVSQGPVEPSTSAVLGRMCQRVACVRLGPARWLRGAWSLAAGRTATEGLFYSRRLRKILDSWAAEIPFDAVLVDCSSMAQYLDVPGLRAVPAIIDLVDVDSQKWFDYANLSSGWKRTLYRLEARRLRRLEASLPARAAALTVVSRREKELFQSFCPTDKIHAIPNGVDLDYFRPPPSLAESPSCVFVGALDYPANVDGVTWFCRYVWPGVRREWPEAEFRIVGSKPGRTLWRLARLPGVKLLGEVPDVRPHVASAAVVVVPLRVARGIQNKVLEALAQGKAVVATPQALEGIELQPGVHALQAATAAEWIERIGGLLASPYRRLALGRSGRAFVAQHHAWEKRLHEFEQLLALATGETRDSRITGAGQEQRAVKGAVRSGK